MDEYLNGLINRVNRKEEEANSNGYTFQDASKAKAVHNHVLMAYAVLNDANYINYNTRDLLDNYVEGDHIANHEHAQTNFKDIQKRYNKHREQLHAANKTYDTFDIEDLSYYIDLLYEHTHVSEAFDHGRHNIDIHRFGGEFYENIINGYKYVSDPDNNELVYFQVVMGGVWTLIHIGLSDDALVILDYMSHDFKLFLENNKESIFKFLGHPAHIPRMGQSLDWAYAWAYRQLGDDENSALYLNNIIDRHPLYSKDDTTTIFWHTGINRILEAAVELYKMYPTTINKNKILSIIVHNQEQECQEAFESLRESLFAYYSAYKTLKNT